MRSGEPGGPGAGARRVARARASARNARAGRGPGHSARRLGPRHRLPASRPAGPVEGRAPGASDVRRQRQVRQLPREGDGGLPRLRSRPRDGARHGPDRPRQLRPGPRSRTGASRRRSSVATASSSFGPTARTASPPSSRSPTRSAPTPCNSISCLLRRPAAGARPGLGRAASRPGRAALVPPLSGRDVRPPTPCTGRAATRRGTSSAPSATRRISGSGTTWPRTATPRPGPS